MSNQPGQPGPHEFASALAAIADMLVPVREAVVGYRQQMLDQGFDEATAATMAGAYHALLIAMIEDSMRKA